MWGSLARVGPQDNTNGLATPSTARDAAPSLGADAAAAGVAAGVGAAVGVHVGVRPGLGVTAAVRVVGNLLGDAGAGALPRLPAPGFRQPQPAVRQGTDDAHAVPGGGLPGLRQLHVPGVEPVTVAGADQVTAADGAAGVGGP